AKRGEGAVCGGVSAARESETAAAVRRQAAGDDGIREPLSRGDADALVIEERTLAALGDKHLVIGRIVDEAGDHGAIALERDRDGEMRNGMEEIGGAVERIDNPAMGLVGALMRAALFAKKAIIGARFRKFLAHNRLGAAVGGGHKIARALQRNLELFNLAEVALEATAGAMRRLDHDIKDRGVKHAACRKP